MRLVFAILTILLPTSLAAGQKPAFAILVDNTGSMRSQFDTELELAKEIVTQVPEGASISLFRFETDGGDAKTASMHLVLECTFDRLAIKRAIDNFYVVGGQTRLLDSIQDTADRLNEKRSEKCGEYSARNLVVISDGEDRASAVKTADLISSLTKTGTKVYAVGLVSELGTDVGFLSPSPRSKAKDFLEKLTTETNGKVIFPQKKQKSEEIVKQLFGLEAAKTH